MKRVSLLIFVIISIVYVAKSQEIFYGIGFNKTSIRNENVNMIFNRFNEINQWSDPFKNYNDIDGFVLDVSIRKEHSMTSLGFNFRKKNISSEGYDTIGVQRKIDLKNTYNYGYLNWFWHFVDNDHFKMGPGIGFGLGTYRMFRRNSTNDDQDEYFSVIRNHQFLFSILYNFSIYMGDHVSLNVQPYFQCPILNNSEVYFIYLEDNLNPSYTIPEETWDRYREWSLTWGVAVNLSFGGEK
jgi:hypothetical protein